jgi:hypothetical protein
MLDRGLTEDGNGQGARLAEEPRHRPIKILELPDRAQQLIGEGVIHLAAVDQLRAIGSVAPELLETVIAYLDDGNAWAAERLTREPGWVLDAALGHSGNSKVFAAYLHSASAHEIADLRLARGLTSSTSRPRSCTSGSTATPTARRRSGSPTMTSTRPGRPGC